MFKLIVYLLGVLRVAQGVAIDPNGRQGLDRGFGIDPDGGKGA